MQPYINGHQRAQPPAPTRNQRQVMIVAPPGYIAPEVSEALSIADQLEPAPQAGRGAGKAAPYTLTALARVYNQILDAGLHVLSIQPPAPLEAHTRLALTARSVLAAEASTPGGRPPQIVIYETSAVGYGFSWLVQQAAEAARHGLSVERILALLDHLQQHIAAFYITRWPGPVASSRGQIHPVQRVSLGQEQCWYLDQMQHRFICQARGWNLSRTLFRAGGVLETMDVPPLACATDERLLTWVTQAWDAAKTPPLAVAPASASLAALFPRGCVELTLLPEQSIVKHTLHAFYREPETATSRRAGVRQRAGW
jgi:hypothetical protein